jgi:hypothetical protein
MCHCLATRCFYFSNDSIRGFGFAIRAAQVIYDNFSAAFGQGQRMATPKSPSGSRHDCHLAI